MIKINKMACVSMMLLMNACSMNAGAAAMAAMLPKTLKMSLDIKIQKLNQTCYGKVSNEVYAEGGATVQIISGECTILGTQSMGKYGDTTIIPIAQLKRAIDFGNLSAPANKQFYLPRPSTVQNNVVGWDNALLFAFKPSSPLANSKWSGAARNPLQGREYQVIIRLVPLTQALAQSTGQLDAFNSTANPTLIEVWTQVSPSVSGSKAAKQIFDLIVDGSSIDSQTPLVFSASPDGQATISYAVIDQGDNQKKIVSTSFNVGEEAL